MTHSLTPRQHCVAMIATALLLGVLVLAVGCQSNTPPLNASVAKWLDNHAAAISITNDDWPIRGREPDIDSYVLEQGLVMGYEVVTGNSFSVIAYSAGLTMSGSPI